MHQMSFLSNKISLLGYDHKIIDLITPLSPTDPDSQAKVLQRGTQILGEFDPLWVHLECLPLLCLLEFPLALPNFITIPLASRFTNPSTEPEEGKPDEVDPTTTTDTTTDTNDATSTTTDSTTQTTTTTTDIPRTSKYLTMQPSICHILQEAGDHPVHQSAGSGEISIENVFRYNLLGSWMIDVIENECDDPVSTESTLFDTTTKPNTVFLLPNMLSNYRTLTNSLVHHHGLQKVTFLHVGNALDPYDIFAFAFLETPDKQYLRAAKFRDKVGVTDNMDTYETWQIIRGNKIVNVRLKKQEDMHNCNWNLIKADDDDNHANSVSGLLPSFYLTPVGSGRYLKIKDDNALLNTSGDKGTPITVIPKTAALALFSASSNVYLQSEPGVGTSPGLRPQLALWETFRLLSMGTNLVKIMSFHHTYLCNNDGTIVMLSPTATRNSLADIWETEYLSYGITFSQNGEYLSPSEDKKTLRLTKEPSVWYIISAKEKDSGFNSLYSSCMAYMNERLVPSSSSKASAKDKAKDEKDTKSVPGSSKYTPLSNKDK